MFGKTKALFKKYFKIKVFNKLLLSYSTVIIFSLLILSFFVCNNFINTVKNNELELNRKILDSVSNYISYKNTSSNNMIYQLYSNQEIYTDMSCFLKNDFNDYLKYKLDRYCASNSFILTSVGDFIKSCFIRDSDIESIVLFSKPKEFFYMFDDKSSNYYRYSSENMEQKLSETVDKKSIINENTYIYKQISRFNKDNSIYSIIHSFNDASSLKNLGNIIINYNSSTIKNSYSQYKNQLLGYIIVADNEGTVIYDSSDRYNGRKYPYFKLLKSSATSVNLEEESYININTTNSGFIVAGIVPKRSIMNKAKFGIRTVIAISIVLMILAIVLIYNSIRYYSKRTETIVDAMEQLEKGDLSIRIPLSNDEDELNMIAQSFNNMCENLHSYIDKVYLLEIKQKNAELVALQSQINPHFLYNTLESIRMRAISKGSPEVGKMIYLLATLFRNSVKNKMVITLSEEVNNCNLYLQLFKIRFQDKLNFSINIDDNLLKYNIIKFSLQPLIENYIIHGIDLSKNDNFIEINAQLVESNILIVINDNGQGIPNERLESLRNSLEDPEKYPTSSMGINNVNERVKLMYGKDYGLKIYSKEGIGTTINLRIPALKGDGINV